MRKGRGEIVLIEEDEEDKKRRKRRKGIQKREMNENMKKIR